MTQSTAGNEVIEKRRERRGFFAALWAAAAAYVFTRSSEPVRAAAGMQFQDAAGGGFVNNSAGGPTAVFSNSGYTSTSSTFVAYAFQGSATAGVAGIKGSGSAISPLPAGIYGTVNTSLGGTSAGVYGDNSNAAGLGVLGRSGLTAASLGDGIGVQGESAGGIAVRGVISGAKNAIALYGLNNSSYAGPGPGAGGFGVYGLSAAGHGLVGATAAAGAAAVVGATNGVVGAYAAAFYGPVIIGGALTVTGAKSAAVPHPDGSHRLVYCVESPESWFEDFGKGKFHCGRADVMFDPNFAAIVDLDDYHVFVTVYDQRNDVVISERDAKGFRVNATDDKSDAAFSWRVVAKRKDIAGERLAKIDILPKPELPGLDGFSVKSNEPAADAPAQVGHRSTPQTN